MKFSAAISVAFAAEAVNAAALQPRHYTFPSTGSGSWTTVRTTVNQYSNAGLSDVSSEQIRCYTASGQRAPQIQKVSAGGSVTFTASPNIFHQGPIQFYMAKVPAGQTAATWDGAGQVWFKTYSEPAQLLNGGLSWASLNKGSITANIPENLPSGDYLLRIEHIALHQASNAGGAQCVSGGGSGTPKPLVSFPGAYNADDPGIKINIYSTRSYQAPGPAVWTG
ncbi:glycosyl hydrolase family 61-domain-containing protein [Ampelomyces quisqualis]|uniref:lytic cellulose monooxygenase (C4-dehydrogenating) n=1 Tax=Ampelomyces quisqualis TaxID=50730 RepID=A0A6A5QEG0_AMPQU|nr:glycosyl hydrolase family 61-domain-containing protein [Ampelomyces quisqualis]